MTQQNPRELAKLGDPKAIAAILNRQLKPQGIDAQVMRDNGTLQITLESAKVLPQHALVDFIRNGMEKLGVESVYLIKVYGRQTGEDSPVWEDEIDLMPADSLLFPNEGSLSHEPIDDEMDVSDRQSINYDPDSDYDLDGSTDEEEEDRSQEEEEEEYEAEEVQPARKKIPLLPVVLGIILVPVAVLAGLFFTKSGPFQTAEAPPPEVATPSPKSASPKPKSTPSPTPKGLTTGNKPASPSPAAPNATKPSPPAATTPRPTASVSPTSPTPQAAAPSPTPSQAPSVAPSPTPPAASPAPTPATAPSPASPTPPTASPAPTSTTAPSPASPAPRPLVPAAPASNAWREAVNSAQTAANLARIAQSKSEWDTVTSEWQKAVQLMKAVPAGSPNYQTAQKKAVEYQANLEVAKKRAAASE